MKKIITLIAIVALTASCKKNRVCSCTETETGVGANQTTKWSHTVKMTKKDAKTWCEGQNSSSSSGGYSWSTTCVLQ